MRIPYDKYYTSKILAKKVVDKAVATFGLENITEFVEPSAGAGVFLPFLDETGISVRAFDILPEGDGIEMADFLTIDLPYKKGRCVIGNPPFFYKDKIGLAFYRKACMIADYVAFILPLLIYKGSPAYCLFDLVSSERIDGEMFSDREIPCCLNLYRRPKSGQLNVRKQTFGNSKVWFRQFCRNESCKIENIPKDYAFGFCSWGEGVLGNQPTYMGQYANEVYVYCSEKELLEKIRKVSTKENLTELARQYSVSSLRLPIFRYWQYLQEQIPELNEEPPTLDNIFETCSNSEVGKID